VVVEGAGVADGRPTWVPSFFPALPEPFTYRATASEAEARGEAATVKRHHTQLVREARDAFAHITSIHPNP